MDRMKAMAQLCAYGVPASLARRFVVEQKQNDILFVRIDGRWRKVGCSRRDELKRSNLAFAGVHAGKVVHRGMVCEYNRQRINVRACATSGITRKHCQRGGLGVDDLRTAYTSAPTMSKGGPLYPTERDRHLLTWHDRTYFSCDFGKPDGGENRTIKRNYRTKYFTEEQLIATSK